MIQEIIALTIIIFFLLRLGWQYYTNRVSKGQFIFWVSFWFISGLLIIFIRSIDTIAERLGFSSSGIQLLLYISVALLFYWIFRLRLTIEEMSKDITKLTRTISLHTAKQKNKNYEQ